jgi:hypothetical protein
MKTLTSVTVVFALLCGPGACVMNRIDDAPTTVTLPSAAAGPRVSIKVLRGPHWTREMNAGPVTFNVLPQIVIWAQHPDGTFIDTLYVTGALGAFNHGGKGQGQQFWKECFPVWSRRALDAGKVLPDKGAPYADVVTSATPQSTFTVQIRLPAGIDAFDLVAEVNTSADYNAAFTEENTGWVGQPSAVYLAHVPAAGRGAFVLSAVGQGEGVATGKINTDLSTLDTALKVVSEIRAEIRD